MQRTQDAVADTDADTDRHHTDATLADAAEAQVIIFNY